MYSGHGIYVDVIGSFSIKIFPGINYLWLNLAGYTASKSGEGSIPLKQCLQMTTRDLHAGPLAYRPALGA